MERITGTPDKQAERVARAQFSGGASWDQVTNSSLLSKEEVLTALRNVDGFYTNGDQAEIDRRLAGLKLAKIQSEPAFQSKP